MRLPAVGVGVGVGVAAALLVAAVLPGAARGNKRYKPPRYGLEVVEPSALREQTKYSPCENGAEGSTCYGIAHSEALFGVPKYGGEIRGRLEVWDNGGDLYGCQPWVGVLPNWSGQYIVLMKRGGCHFTIKVRNAARLGAAGVIVQDNRIMANEPLATCPDYSPPLEYDDASKAWVTCDKKTTNKCYCGKGTTFPVATPLGSAPLCAGRPAVHQAQCASATITGACWYCSTTNSYYSTECVGSQETQAYCVAETLLPFMADDGDAGDIQIPSFLVSDYYGQLLRNAAINGKAATPPVPTTVRMGWDIKHTDVVDYELWTSCEDSNGAEFKRDFQETALKLIDVAAFTPHYYIYDGKALRCNDFYDCGTQCVKTQGLYCGPDPDGDLDNGVTGADVVMENLRQLCIWQILSTAAAKPDADKAGTMKWWCYVNDFGDTCFNSKEAMVSSSAFATCAKDTMARHDIDAAAVQTCMDGSFRQDGSNVILADEIQARQDYNVLKLPEVVVNGQVLRGQTSYGATLELNVAQTICNAFNEPPAACEGILEATSTVAATGKGKVKFTTTLSYTGSSAASPLLVSHVSDKMRERMRSVVSLKLGVAPQNVDVGTPAGTANAVTVPVNVDGLTCSGGAEDKTATSKLQAKVQDCEAEATSGSEVAGEAEHLISLSFHVFDGSDNKQVVAKISGVAEDESACPAASGSGSASGGGGTDGNPGGVGSGVVVLIAILVSGVVFTVAFFVYRHFARKQMRNEVRSILAEYMPLDDDAAGDGDLKSAEMAEI